jgi:hypothetical protein
VKKLHYFSIIARLTERKVVTLTTTTDPQPTSTPSRPTGAAKAGVMLRSMATRQVYGLSALEYLLYTIGLFISSFVMHLVLNGIGMHYQPQDTPSMHFDDDAPPVILGFVIVALIWPTAKAIYQAIKGNRRALIRVGTVLVMIIVTATGLTPWFRVSQSGTAQSIFGLGLWPSLLAICFVVITSAVLSLYGVGGNERRELTKRIDALTKSINDRNAKKEERANELGAYQQQSKSASELKEQAEADEPAAKAAFEEAELAHNETNEAKEAKAATDAVARAEKLVVSTSALIEALEQLSSDEASTPENVKKKDQAAKDLAQAESRVKVTTAEADQKSATAEATTTGVKLAEAAAAQVQLVAVKSAQTALITAADANVASWLSQIEAMDSLVITDEAALDHEKEALGNMATSGIRDILFVSVGVPLVIFGISFYNWAWFMGWVVVERS